MDQFDPPILVIEDDGATRDLFLAVLAEQRWPAFGAATGAEALIVAAAAPPCLVVLDMHLPDQSPVQVARQLRSLAPRLPIIATSASDERITAALLGACAFLDKPFDLEDLLGLVHEALFASPHPGVRSRALRSESARSRARLRANRERLAGWAQRSTTLTLLEDLIARSGARAGVLVLPRPGHMLEVASAVGVPENLVDVWQRFPAGMQAPIADAAGGEPIWLPTLESGTQRYPDLMGALSTTPWAAGLCALPLGLGPTSWGALGLLFAVPCEFSDSVRERISDSARALADHLAVSHA
ncbi:MAG: response regulator [Chloroflexi bacterium]|nr:response regulator [Chloroflexota bacterium]